MSKIKVKYIEEEMTFQHIMDNLWATSCSFEQKRYIEKLIDQAYELGRSEVENELS